MPSSSSSFFRSLAAANPEPLPASVTADTVKSYLGDHPEFLDTYIQQNVNSNTIEQWRSKKTPTPASIPTTTQRETSASSHPPMPHSVPAPLPRSQSSFSSASSTTMPTSSVASNRMPSSTSRAPLTTAGKTERTTRQIYHHRSLISSQQTTMIYDHMCSRLLFRFSDRNDRLCLVVTTTSTGESSQQMSSTTAHSLNKVKKAERNRLSPAQTAPFFQLTELNNQRRLLHELTDDVNQNVSKAQILFELCKSIASSSYFPVHWLPCERRFSFVSFSGIRGRFQFVLGWWNGQFHAIVHCWKWWVSELSRGDVHRTSPQTRTVTITPFSPFLSEQATFFVPIRIGIGFCIAGYVASSKETVRINNIALVEALIVVEFLLLTSFQLDKDKYPDGLYVKDDKVTAVMAHPIINASGTLLGNRDSNSRVSALSLTAFHFCSFRCGGILSNR